MEKFKLEVTIDPDNTWMNTEFSLGTALTRVGEKLMRNRTTFQQMHHAPVPIEDVYGNIVGNCKMVEE